MGDDIDQFVEADAFDAIREGEGFNRDVDPQEVVDHLAALLRAMRLAAASRRRGDAAKLTMTFESPNTRRAFERALHRVIR